MQQIKKEIEKGNLLQVNTIEDAYYLGTYHQIVQFCDIKTESIVDGFIWISDFDVCISKKMTVIFKTPI